MTSIAPDHKPIDAASQTIGVFVTGTDTGVGKTLASVALIHRLRANGLRVVGMKPVASGCELGQAGWRNEDALRLQAASDPRPHYAALNPYALPLPTAPSVAAAAAGVKVEIDTLIEAYRGLAAQADAVVVEGAGGWAAPFDRGLEQSALARSLGIPVILVVGLRLGCLSHARLTARAIVDDGLVFAGWIANTIDPSFADTDAYLGLLSDALPAPCLGVLPFREMPDAAALSGLLGLPVGLYDRA
jgi:dethiobiotin synthetase